MVITIIGFGLAFVILYGIVVAMKTLGSDDWEQ